MNDFSQVKNQRINFTKKRKNTKNKQKNTKKQNDQDYLLLEMLYFDWNFRENCEKLTDFKLQKFLVRRLYLL